MERLSVSMEEIAAPQGTAPSVQKRTCISRVHSGGDAGDPEIQSQ